MLSIILIIFGVLAITLPMATSAGVVMIIGWLVIFDGLAQLAHAAQSKGIGHIVWKILSRCSTLWLEPICSLTRLWELLDSLLFWRFSYALKDWRM